jgi:hypothetical protein
MEQRVYSSGEEVQAGGKQHGSIQQLQTSTSTVLRNDCN